MFGGREFATGLGNIASSTGGAFFAGVGTAAGALDRIVSDINYFYQLGVEALPTDADGRTHGMKVEVTRQKVSVRAPAEIAAARRPKGADVEAVTSALAQPTDIAEVPFEVATYVTHADQPDKVRVIVSASVPVPPGFVPAEWGYLVLDGGKVLGGSREQITLTSPERWAASASLVLPIGRYRIRAALIAADGRVATLDLPLHAGLRTAGAVQASDLIVGTPSEGRVEPSASLRQGDPGVAMIELSSAEPLVGTNGVVELTRAGTAQPAVKATLELRTRAKDTTVVAGQASLDLSGLAPGTYMASAVLDRGGQPFARISRLVEVTAGEAIPAPATADVTNARPPRASSNPGANPGANPGRDPALEDVLQRVGRYVANYGEQASLIIAVERYEQRYQNAPAGQPSGRKLLAEFALFKTRDETGWVGFRDVISADGKAVADCQDRLQALLRAGTPDVVEARRIADESARFNIGPTRRNFNEPTAVLFFLLPASQARFTFDRQGMTTVNGVTAMEIDFKETARPTVIRTSEGRDVASQGTIWVSPSDGTVLRTNLTVSGFGGPRTSSAIDVTFARDARLNLWLPAKMTERHEAPAILARGPNRVIVPDAVVTATATYGDFKRFETSTSILGQVMTRRIIVAALVIACAGSTASSQQSPVPTFKSGLELLTVEATVRDGAGRPVTDLQPSDFVVSIDGQPRRVLNARIFGSDDVRVAKAGTPVPRFARAADAAPGRLIVFAVDRDSIRSGSEAAILDTASAMISSLSAADAVGVIGLPVGGIDPTRDHAAAAAAVRLMTGTRPSVQWRYRLTWREAVELEKGHLEEIKLVVERECTAFNTVFSPSNRDRSLELQSQAREMVAMGRGHAETVLTRLGALLDSLRTERAPKHLVLFSGGIAFDVEMLSRYRDLATKAAQARASIFVVHLDQPVRRVGADGRHRFQRPRVYDGPRRYRVDDGWRLRRGGWYGRRRVEKNHLGDQHLLSTGSRGAAERRGRPDTPCESRGHASEPDHPRSVRDCSRAGAAAFLRRGHDRARPAVGFSLRCRSRSRPT